MAARASGHQGGVAVIDIREQTLTSDVFRRVLHTGRHTQVVIMTIPPGGAIGMETHPDNDQVLVVVAGRAESVLDGVTQEVGEGQMVVVPAGVEHDVRNAGDEALRLYTVYGPPDHPDGVVHRTREEAEAAEAEGHDEPPST